MKYLPNIEKSAFRRFEYVGYAEGRVYRVRKHGCGGWEAWLNDATHAGLSAVYLRAPTLEKISDMLTTATR
jgi:hypothetical protein